MAILWLEFILLSALVVISGANLSKYGDVIAEKTGLGRAWIGLILMASITSLPELITGISSVAIVNVPNIALGDIMGSCVYNLAILALMDAVNGRKSLFLGVDRGHLLGAGFGVILISVVIISILFEQNIPSLGHIGLATPLIMVIYFIGIRAVYYYEKNVIEKGITEAAEKLLYLDVPLGRAAVLYGVNAVVIIIAATFLPYVGAGLAEATGLGNTFVGSVFVAMTTSLPEVVVSIAAVRIGALDLAIANMLGSNMFNILVLAVDDVFYTQGPLFSHVSMNHSITGLMAVIMTAIVVIGITYPPERKAFVILSFRSVTLAVMWILTIFLLYITGVGL
jgi:cation:H+ antiporter